MTGNNGWCNLLNAQTGHWVHGFKIEGTIVDFAFANDESFIMIVNSAGEVWEFALEGKSLPKPQTKSFADGTMMVVSESQSYKLVVKQSLGRHW